MSVLFLTYIFCMVLGGAFVGLSVLGGLFDTDADGDADFDVDGDADFDLDAGAHFDLDAHADVAADVHVDFDAEHGYGSDIEMAVGRRFNPFVSFKFYTFFLAFFGLTGVIFTAFGLWGSEIGVLILSLALGLFSGLSVAYTIFRLSNDAGSRGIMPQDYIGIPAKIMLPVRADKAGKARMFVRGHIIEMPAKSADDDVVFDFGEDCFVLGIEDGVVQVVQPSALLNSSQPTLEGE